MAKKLKKKPAKKVARKKATSKKTYTYRNGKKVYLKKEPDHFVVR